MSHYFAQQEREIEAITVMRREHHYGWLLRHLRWTRIFVAAVAVGFQYGCVQEAVDPLEEERPGLHERRRLCNFFFRDAVHLRRFTPPLSQDCLIDAHNCGEAAAWKAAVRRR